MFRLDLVAQTAATPIHNPVYAFTAGIWLLQKRNYYRIPKNVQRCFQIRFSLFSMLPLPYPSPKKKAFRDISPLVFMAVPPAPPPPRLKKKVREKEGWLSSSTDGYLAGNIPLVRPPPLLTQQRPPFPEYPEIDFAYVRLIRIAQPFISHSKRKKFATFPLQSLNVCLGKCADRVTNNFPNLQLSTADGLPNICCRNPHSLLTPPVGGISDPFHVCCCCYLVFNP